MVACAWAGWGHRPEGSAEAAEPEAPAEGAQESPHSGGTPGGLRAAEGGPLSASSAPALVPPSGCGPCACG